MPKESPVSVTEWLVTELATDTVLVGGVEVPYLTKELLGSSVVHVIVAPFDVTVGIWTLEITGGLMSGTVSVTLVV